MLVSLHVKNLALIEEAEVEFQHGLNILSGETGAGKSIIIGSINLALGEKVPKDMLRENDDCAFVELIFKVENSEQMRQLAELEIVPEDGMVILSRKITSSRSVCRINAETVPASMMKKVGSFFIDIHGQHEHQSLLQKRKHLEILDEYAKERLKDKKQKMEELFLEYRKIQKELEQAVTDETQRNREMSFLEYEIQEITKAQLKPGEDEILEQEYRRLCHGKKILEAVENAYEMTGNRAGDFIGRACKELMAVVEYEEALENMTRQLTQIDGLLNDFNRELSEYRCSAEFSDEELQQIEQRLDLINGLKTKYGNTIEKILQQKEEKEKQYEILQNYQQYLEELGEKQKVSQEALAEISAEVSKIRKEMAEKLTQEIKVSLSELNFLDVSFSMEFTEMEEFTANGKDDAEFLISTNPGEPRKPLGKVASGGELSRIMLAIKTILAENDKIDTMIFDEIDTGISGRTAQMVAEKMNVIGRKHQVICITHLPQIAAMADKHFLIEKNVVNHTTVSTIIGLEEETSVLELSRMIGGVKVTDTVKKSAEEMRNLALSVKKSQR